MTMEDETGLQRQPQEDVDMEYEDCAPQERRGSMTVSEEKERRSSIQNIMADPSMSPATKRRSIQHLMDGRRASMETSQHTAAPIISDSSDEISAETCANGGYICNYETRMAEVRRPECTHYERNCTIIAPCCGGAFGCRICHDECDNLPRQINNGRQFHRSASLPSSFTSMAKSQVEDNSHTIDRFAIREVICRECFTRQSSKTTHCIKCGVQFGLYHCDICNLWMSDEEEPYHCHDCGFCRIGGAHCFQHCHGCGMCIDKSLFDAHNCKAGKYRSNCPVCQEYLFSSRGASHEMPCGHAIHWDCFKQLAVHDSRCPICKKTAETKERMMPTWNAMAAGVAMQPVPPELCRVVEITCNDCEKADSARSWHFLGTQCTNCCSFNTVVDRIVMQGEEAHNFLEMQKLQKEGAAMNGGRPRQVNRRRSLF